MLNRLNKFKAALTICLVLGVVFRKSIVDDFELMGVRTIALSPSNVQLPNRWPLPLSLGRSKSSQYIFGGDKSGYHLYFVGNSTSQEVIGDPFSSERSKLLNPSNFGGFLDVPSSSGIITYTSYAFYDSVKGIGGMGSEVLVDSGLFALQGNRIRRLLRDIDPHGLFALDAHQNSSEYLDKRGNLFVMTTSRVLCVIRDGHVVAKADVSQLTGAYSKPGMFSDNENTYFLVPKMFEVRTSLHNFNEDTTQAKYRIEF